MCPLDISSINWQYRVDNGPTNNLAAVGYQTLTFDLDQATQSAASAWVYVSVQVTDQCGNSTTINAAPIQVTRDDTSGCSQ